MSRTDGPQAIRENLARIGMTDAELDVWQTLAEGASSMSGLPLLHPNENEETSRIFNDLRSRVLERPGLRAIGWPGPSQYNNQQELEELVARGRRNLVELGMTNAELNVWYALGRVAGVIAFELPELYPMQQEESAHDFHKLQSRLLASPVLRAAGQESRTPDPEAIPGPRVSRESLAASGMTDEEIDAWEELAKVADCMYQLPAVYQGERREIQQDFHDIELRLMARPALRAMG